MSPCNPSFFLPDARSNSRAPPCFSRRRKPSRGLDLSRRQHTATARTEAVHIPGLLVPRESRLLCARRRGSARVRPPCSRSCPEATGVFRAILCWQSNPGALRGSRDNKRIRVFLGLLLRHAPRRPGRTSTAPPPSLTRNQFRHEQCAPAARQQDALFLQSSCGHKTETKDRSPTPKIASWLAARLSNGNTSTATGNRVLTNLRAAPDVFPTGLLRPSRPNSQQRNHNHQSLHSINCLTSSCAEAPC